MKHFFLKLATAIGAFKCPSEACGSRFQSGIAFLPSIQGDLFNCLKPEQREFLRPILRVIKRPYQADLCSSLLDYLEGNGRQPTGNPLLDCLLQSIIEECGLRPLRLNPFSQQISDI